MARTKASVGAKVSSGKSSKARAIAPPPTPSRPRSGITEKSSRSYSGGNPVYPRETPKWQKPITNFMTVETISKEDKADSEEPKGFSNEGKKKSKMNVIESDEEEEIEKPKNTVLDESIELEPLTGEDSHKIEEYYSRKQEKNKGIGKKSNKENINTNNGRSSSKRELDSSDVQENSSKKVKV
ncbi:hypothetical protein EVAR_92894_1 [Eumeta japonica]|uniref:PCNA-associated factor n=1 Tax=Eumeta variegata TaxID=151549 RepID=A0A4C1TD46_EUMVA|nr:hypothetical protein EVAR_92894_1 [Eumeta japonica]